MNDIDHKERATQLLIGYFQTLYERAGLGFHYSSECEIRELVNELVLASQQRPADADTPTGQGS